MTIQSKAYCNCCGEELKESDRIVCIADTNCKNVKRVISPTFKFLCERCHLMKDNI